MRVGFDRQAFTIQKYGGISRYFTDLYLGLRKRPEVQAELLFEWHQNAYLGEKGIGELLHPLAVRLYWKAMTKGNLRVPLARQRDIHHSTYYLGIPPKKHGNVKLVSTLYDMIPELFPRLINRNRHANKLDWFKASDLIISISDSAAADLIYFQPFLEKRIRRIHLYSGFSTLSPQSKPTAIGASDIPYLLFVGSREGYKNGAMLLRAFAASEPSRHGHNLVFAGGGALTNEELASIDRLGITAHVQQISVNDAELWYLYQNAKAVVVPSMAEGFSLPLVEGLVADVPIVCSDIPVHREVAGGFAIFVNALQHQDWADVLDSIDSLARPSVMLQSASYKEKCRYYSRERMVEEHVDAYSALLP